MALMSRHIPHLHVLVGAFLNLFLFLLVTSRTLSLEVLATSIGGGVFVDDFLFHSDVGITHLGILAVLGGDFLFDLDLDFIRAIGSLVVWLGIGLWLFWWKFGGCGGLGVPD
jgi:hypothetical protein